MAGGVAERLKAVVLKTIVLQGTVGSNPTSSAIDTNSNPYGSHQGEPGFEFLYGRHSTA